MLMGSVTLRTVNDLPFPDLLGHWIELIVHLPFSTVLQVRVTNGEPSWKNVPSTSIPATTESLASRTSMVTDEDQFPLLSLTLKASRSCTCMVPAGGAASLQGMDVR